ncbi:MAG: fused MFS/spermidine synthase [Thermomicrobiales bacterium]
MTDRTTSTIYLNRAGFVTEGTTIDLPEQLSRADARFIKLIVFIGGMTSLGAELCASRLIAPYFGTSTFIWANVIGLTLTFLAIGYWLGGKAADSYPRLWLLYSITSISALFVGLTPFLARPVLQISLDAFDNVEIGAFYGSLVGVLIILAVPVTLLGFVSPYAIRMLVPDVSHSGNTSGNIYAIGTVGSIAGSFLPVLILIPLVGTTRTFLILGLILLVPSVIALIRLRAIAQASLSVAMAIMLAAVSAVVDQTPIRPAERGVVIYETESEENYIQVVQDGDRVLLSLNDGHAWHSIYDPGTPLTGGPWDYFMVGPLFTPTSGAATIDNALLIGLAGGTVSKQLTLGYGPVPIDGVEIDGEIARVGREYFDMNEPNLNVLIDDGRYVLRTSTTSYDLIGVDAYRQPYIPFQLTTREFFQEIDDRLTPEGVAVMNVGRTETDFRLVDAIASTMNDVFASVFIIDLEFSDNSMVIGTQTPTSLDTFAQSVAAQPAGSIVREVGETSIATGSMREVTESGEVWTDDYAPVERVVDQIIFGAARDENENETEP